MLRFVVVENNIDPTKDKRLTKATKRNTMYRDKKSKPHTTIKGRGVVSRLFKNK